MIFKYVEELFPTKGWEEAKKNLLLFKKYAPKKHPNQAKADQMLQTIEKMLKK